MRKRPDSLNPHIIGECDRDSAEGLSDVFGVAACDLIWQLTPNYASPIDRKDFSPRDSRMFT